MPAKSTKSRKSSSPKELFVKVMVVLSILGNVFFITSAIAVAVLFNSNMLDFFIWNMALTTRGINYNTPGGCLNLDKDLIKGTSIQLDSKGRVVSGDGKVQCIVVITSQEADAIQQKLDAEQANPPKQ